MATVFDILNDANRFFTGNCPKCGYEWELRAATPVKKCPSCQHLLMRSREPWPPGYVRVRFSPYNPVPPTWPQIADPDPEIDYDWIRERNRRAAEYQERMSA